MTVAPLPEQAVIAYNAGRPPVPLAAFYLSPPPPPLDYPYVAMPGLNSAQAAAADALRAVLTGAAFRNALAGDGLRAVDGTAGAGFAAGGAVPDAASVKAVLRTWAAVTARS